MLIAVLTFQFFTTPGGHTATLVGLALALLAAAGLGGPGGFATGFAFRRGWVPEHLEPLILMVLVLSVYWSSNLVQHEAGLLSITLMGLVLGNMRLSERESLRHSKENLTVVVLSVLFIVVPATLGPEHLRLLDVRSVAFVAAVMLVVRPLASSGSTRPIDRSRSGPAGPPWCSHPTGARRWRRHRRPTPAGGRGPGRRGHGPGRVGPCGS